MIDRWEHSHGATDPYVASFLDSRLETQYTIRELTKEDLQLTSLESLRNEGITYVVVGYETPGTGCRVDSPLERLLQAQGPPLASFAPTTGCPQSVFDPIDTYYVPLAGYARAGVARYVFYVSPAPRDDAERRLDHLAGLIEEYRGAGG